MKPTTAKGWSCLRCDREHGFREGTFRKFILANGEWPHARRNERGRVCIYLQPEVAAQIAEQIAAVSR